MYCFNSRTLAKIAPLFLVIVRAASTDLALGLIVVHGGSSDKPEEAGKEKSEVFFQRGSYKGKKKWTTCFFRSYERPLLC